MNEQNERIEELERRVKRLERLIERIDIMVGEHLESIIETEANNRRLLVRAFSKLKEKFKNQE